MPSETDEDDLAELMVGRNVQLTVDRGESHPGRRRAAGRRTCGPTTIAARRSSGASTWRSAPARSWASPGSPATARTSSSRPHRACAPDRRQGHPQRPRRHGRTPRSLYEAGLAHVPGDRHRWGLIMRFSVDDNLVLTSYYRPPSPGASSARTTRSRLGPARRSTLRHPHALGRRSGRHAVGRQPAEGGRGARVQRQPKLLVLDQPTRGLDVGSIEFIHRRAIEMRDAGAAILLVSAELDEVLELSDRIAVMYRGEIVKTSTDARRTRRRSAC